MHVSGGEEGYRHVCEIRERVVDYETERTTALALLCRGVEYDV